MNQITSRIPLFSFILLLPLLTFCAPVNRTASPSQDPAWQLADAIVQSIVIPEFPARDYLITDYGALGDGTTDCRPAFERAIAECSKAGGGRIVVPAGVFFSRGPVHLKSKIHLYLAKGAELRFSPEPDDYLPVVLTKWEGTELYNYSPMIYAYQAVNVAVTGDGLIDGNAGQTFATWKSKQREAQDRLRQMGIDGVPVHERVFGKDSWIRPVTIQFFGCTNVLVDGVTIHDAPFWVIHPVYCTNVTVRNVRVESWNPNNDGCDPDASTNVLIENCTFSTGDDAVAIKAGRDADGWRVGRATENVVIRNCNMRTLANGLCIGSEMSGGVRNIFMENCMVDSAGSTIYFKANLDRGGIVENVWVRNVEVVKAKFAAIRFESNYQGYRGNLNPPLFQNFVIENITCGLAPMYGIFAEGVEQSRLNNIVMRNVTIDKAQIPYRIKYADGFTLENVRINGAPAPEHPEMTPDSVKVLRQSW